MATFAPDDLDRFITIAEAAPRLRMSRSKAFRLAKDGYFPVPVRVVGGKQVVCLRHVIELVRSDEAVAS